MFLPILLGLVHVLWLVICIYFLASESRYDNSCSRYDSDYSRVDVNSMSRFPSKVLKSPFTSPFSPFGRHTHNLHALIFISRSMGVSHSEELMREHGT